jgi:hypothetical protein
MIGRRAVIGLSLLSALLVCAFAAQSASAVETESKRTTFYTCVDSGILKNGDFEDEHCDKRGNNPGKEKFRHDLIKIGETTAIVGDNTPTTGEEKKPAVLKGNIGITKTEISCETFKTDETKSWIENSEPVAKDHKATGTARNEFSKCTVKAPAKCTIKEPIISEATIRGVEGLEGPKGEKNAMGLRFTGEIEAEGKKETFANITYEGVECALKGKTFPVTGKVIATSGPTTESAQENAHSGATLIFTPKFSMQKLHIGNEANKAEFETHATSRMNNGSPISMTTVT